MTWPDLVTEQQWWDTGAHCVVGIDEVGKGSWVGPLTLAAVVLRRDAVIAGLRDSKLLSPKRRAELYAARDSWCESYGVGHASARECDLLGMSEAQRLAGQRALENLALEPDRVLVDGRWDFIENGCTTTIIKGDQTVASIAGASIIAKVVRDELLVEMAEHYPVYHLDENKGYPSPSHRTALAGYGPCPEHRQSWVFMDKLPWTGIARFDRTAESSLTLF